MPTTCVILRDHQSASTAGPFDPGAANVTFGPAGAVPPEPSIAVETVENRELRDLGRDPSVKAIAPLMPTILVEPVQVEASGVGDAWGIAAVKADTSPFTGANVVVAVLDTGIDKAHPAFTGVTIDENDFSGSGNGDVTGHGTHCAGTIFGRDVDGARIGVARGVTNALIGKVLANDGRGDSEMIFRGIQWALEQGAHVISMSLGFDFPGMVKRLETQNMPTELATSLALEAYRANLRMFDALMAMARARQAFGAGTVFVAAAGNESHRELNANFEVGASLPAAAEGMVSVGALQQGAGGLSIANFSNTFPEISAPGFQIKSAKPGGGTQLMSGTSMATPHTAGVAALWWQQVLTSPVPATARTVTAKLLSTARLDALAPGIDIADRGVGLATAP